MSYRLIAGALSALLSLGFLNADESAPNARILPGTTLVEPRIPDTVQGRIRRLNEELSRDLKPANNAAVGFLQLFGADAFDAELREASLAMMGIRTLSTAAPRLVSRDDYIRANSSGNLDEDLMRAATLQSRLQAAHDRPWSPDEWPDLAAYVKANAAALDSIADIVALKRYYVPVLSPEVPPSLTAASTPVELRLAGLAQLLTVRAMGRDSRASADLIVADLMTTHRLALMLAEGAPFDVSLSKAQLMEAYACQGVMALLRSGQLSPVAARDYRKQLDALPRLPLAAFTADRGERAILEQELELFEHDETPVREYLEIAKEKRLADLETTRLADVKWKLALERATEIQDRVVAALKIDDHRRQEEKFAELDRIYDAWMAKSGELSQPTAGAVEMDLDAVSRWIGETVAMSLRCNYRQRRASDDRAQVRREMSRIGLALILYADDHGKFPESLQELSPRYIDKLPLDAHSEAPFKFERRSDGSAVLASWGRNQVDDAGQFYNDDTILKLAPPATRP